MNTMGGKESQLLTMLEPTVGMLGYELWGLELLSPNRRPTLRVYMPGSEVETTPDAQLNSIGIAGAKALENAIVAAVRSAKSVGDVVACCNWHND